MCRHPQASRARSARGIHPAPAVPRCMMIRFLGAVVLALTAATVAAPALAQSSSGPTPYYRSAPPPDRAGPSRILPYPDEAEAVPPPPPSRPTCRRALTVTSSMRSRRPPERMPTRSVRRPRSAPPRPAPRRSRCRRPPPPRCRRRISRRPAIPRNCRTICAASSSSFRTREPAGTIIIDTPQHLSLSGPRPRPGAALRHRRRPRGLHLVGHRAHLRA